MKMLSIEKTKFKNEKGLKGMKVACTQCGHEFIARTYFPRICPECNSSSWFVPNMLNKLFPLEVQCGLYLAGRMYIQAVTNGYKNWRKRVKSDVYHEYIFLPYGYELFEGKSAQEVAEAFKNIGAKVSADDNGYYILL